MEVTIKGQSWIYTSPIARMKTSMDFFVGLIYMMQISRINILDIGRKIWNDSEYQNLNQYEQP